MFHIQYFIFNTLSQQLLSQLVPKKISCKSKGAIGTEINVLWGTGSMAEGKSEIQSLSYKSSNSQNNNSQKSNRRAFSLPLHPQNTNICKSYFTRFLHKYNKTYQFRFVGLTENRLLHSGFRQGVPCVK